MSKTSAINLYMIAMSTNCLASGHRSLTDSELLPWLEAMKFKNFTK
jgi:hypothetical protein